jgi:hypothetical protein
MNTAQRIALIVGLLITAASGDAGTQLTMTRSGVAVVLSWPLEATNDFYLQFTTNLSLPIKWTNAPDPTTNGANLVITNQVADSSRFYRLQAWEPLFDGTSTAAFRGYQQADAPGTNQWMVTTNGELMAVSNAAPVHLITRVEYGSYELRWEWKASIKGNSGVIYRANETYSNVASGGPEYQLLDDLGYSQAAYQNIGAAYRLFTPTNKLLVPVGQWNQCRLLVESNHVEHWLNGRKIVDYQINSPAWSNAVTAAGAPFNVAGFGQGTGPGVGHIVFLNQTSPTWYRDIKLRQLPLQ